MKQNFLSRLEKLEAITSPVRGPIFRHGYLTPLPEDYVGERHIVRVEEAPAEGVDPTWCRFEERPGPAPPRDPPRSSLTGCAAFLSPFIAFSASQILTAAIRRVANFLIVTIPGSRA